MKKEIEMRNAYIRGDHLCGQIKDHHTMNIDPIRGEYIRSSKIIKRDGNTVETMNTIYKVKSWAIFEVIAPLEKDLEI